MWKLLFLAGVVVVGFVGVTLAGCALNSTTFVDLDEIPNGSCIEVVKTSRNVGQDETRFRLVPCSGEKAYQVVQRIHYEDMEYPGTGTLEWGLEWRCFDESDWFVYPTEKEWNDGIRTALCVAARIGEVESEELGPLPVVQIDEVSEGDCFRVLWGSAEDGQDEANFMLMPCTGREDYQVVKAFKIPWGWARYPDGADFMDLEREECGVLLFHLFEPTEQQWEDGIRTAFCARYHGRLPESLR